MLDTRLEPGTWVLVADSEKALFLENVGSPANPSLKVLRKDTQVNPPARDQAANEPGRKGDGAGPQGSKMQDTDWHELEKIRFADDLAERLYKLAHDGRFQAIVLVADPKVLGEMRGKLHKEVQSRVVAEVAKNLTQHEIDEIARVVKEEVETR